MPSMYSTEESERADSTIKSDSSLLMTQSHNLNRNVSDASSASSTAPNSAPIIDSSPPTVEKLNSNSQNSIDESTSFSSLNESSTSLPIIPNDELELLVRLERANKEMETNNRSAQSILQAVTTTTSSNGLNSNRSPSTSHSLSRRASITSDVNSINTEDAISKLDEISWELWNQIITEWNVWSKKKPGQLKEYIRKGIPVYLRPLAWQYLCGANASDSKDKYKEYIKRQSSCEKIIRRDVDRTYPDNEFFRNPAGQESLFNVMKAYSIHDPEVGYCQGSAFICGLLLIQSIPEEEAFAIFVQIMHQYNLREIYKPNMYHLGLCMFQLDAMLQESIPDLHKHFAAHAFYPSMYSSSWFLTLFTTALPLSLVCRIFDIFLSEGFEIVFRVGLAILECHKDNLMTMDMEGMIKYFQKELPTKHETDHDGFLNKAFAVKYNARKMKKLEKDFTIIKKEEQEEQVEIRRLRAENKLLKQRIDNLEKAFAQLSDESASLADRLIKGQVVNAQSAESIYILKNENQKLKDKIADLQSQYEQEVEQRRKQTSEQDNTSNEREILHEKVNMLLEENNKLRETPDNQRFEEELVQVKLREAEAQLAIKDLQKTLHVLNLEYQQFLNNRGAVLLSLNAPPISNNSTGSSPTPSSSSVANTSGLSRSDFEALEEELLKVKMREAEEVSELKAVNLKLMQLETEKQVAYKQIKRQDEEIRRLNQTIYSMKEKELETKSQLMDSKRQVDDKDALLKELNMTHKLQEAEDAHVIAELRQRVAALEVQIQEVVTQGQLNYNNQKIISSATSQYDLHQQNNGRMNQRTTSSAELTEDMKYMMLMSSTGSLLLDGNKRANSMADEETISSPTTPTTPSVFSKTISSPNGHHGESVSSHVKNFLTRSQSDEPAKSVVSPFKEADSTFVINEAISEADHQQLIDETVAN